MPTNSKPAYDRNTERARHFIQIHEDAQQGAGAPARQYRELPRAAIVFSVGAIDAYLSEVSAEVMIRQFQTNVANSDTRFIMSKIQKEIPTLALEIAVLPTNPERIQRVRESIVEHFHNNVSNHGAKAVASTMQRMGSSANAVWDHLRNHGYQNPVDQLDRWTDVRHQIVHQGTRPTVRRYQAADFIEFADAIVNRIDSIAENI